LDVDSFSRNEMIASRATAQGEGDDRTVTLLHIGPDAEYLSPRTTCCEFAIGVRFRLCPTLAQIRAMLHALSRAILDFEAYPG
jgi:hypothetical protein